MAAGRGGNCPEERTGSKMKKDFVLSGYFCTHMTTGTEHVVKRLKSSALQSGSQQQLVSHCATSRSQTQSLATAAESEMRAAAGTRLTSTCHLALVLTVVKSFLQIQVFFKLFLKSIFSAAEQIYLEHVD